MNFRNDVNLFLWIFLTVILMIAGFVTSILAENVIYLWSIIICFALTPFVCINLQYYLIKRFKKLEQKKINLIYYCYFWIRAGLAVIIPVIIIILDVLFYSFFVAIISPYFRKNKKKIDMSKVLASEGEKFDINNYSEIVPLTVDQYLEGKIREELKNNNVDEHISLEPIELKKNVYTVLYGIILCICFSLLFFHTPNIILLTIFIAVTIFYRLMIVSCNIINYLIKEVKIRPDEKFRYLVSSVISDRIDNKKHKRIRFSVMMIAFFIPLIIFNGPIVFYEKNENGYEIRYYTTGWLRKDKDLVIPEKHNGEPVVGIQEKVFANVKSLETVTLPDSIINIGSEAFKDDINLRRIKLPSSLKKINTYTFYGCNNLEMIVIPDEVTSIEDYAFANNGSLEIVYLSKNSKLGMIDSNSFDKCSNLNNIYLPSDTKLGKRTFLGLKVKKLFYNHDNVELEKKYKYNSFVNIKVDEEKIINNYVDEAKLQNATLSLISVNGGRGSYSYVFMYKDGNYEETFILSMDENSKAINDSLTIKLVDDDNYNFYSISTPLSLVAYFD